MLPRLARTALITYRDAVGKSGFPLGRHRDPPNGLIILAGMGLIGVHQAPITRNGFDDFYRFRLGATVNQHNFIGRFKFIAVLAAEIRLVAEHAHIKSLARIQFDIIADGNVTNAILA